MQYSLYFYRQHPPPSRSCWTNSAPKLPHLQFWVINSKALLPPRSRVLLPSLPNKSSSTMVKSWRFSSFLGLSGKTLQTQGFWRRVSRSTTHTLSLIGPQFQICLSSTKTLRKMKLFPSSAWEIKWKTHMESFLALPKTTTRSLLLKRTPMIGFQGDKNRQLYIKFQQGWYQLATQVEGKVVKRH